MEIQATLPIMVTPAFGHEAAEARADSTWTHRDHRSASASQLQEVDQVLSNLAAAIQPFDISLKFSKDAETGAIVIEMVNERTGETLQQIPNEAMLHVSAVLGKLQGMIFNEQA
jgi:uncharacterized FlaG/YvyC family protein